MSAQSQKYSVWFPIVFGFTCLAILVAGVGLWSVNTKISGAIIANGTLKLEANRQVIQHPEGGVVGAILARDGDVVAAGDSVLKFDGTFLESELAIVEDQLFDLQTRKARLLAERDNLNELVFPPELIAAAKGQSDMTGQIEGQRSLFNARSETIAQQKKELTAQQGQIESQSEGVAAQLAAAQAQASLIAEELLDSESLLEKGLMQASRVLALRRSEAEILGSIGRLTAEISNLQGTVSQLNIRALQLDTDRREQAITELREIQSSELELAERRLVILERKSRLDVRAPMDGIVYGSAVFALKSVVRAADPIMYIIPKGQPMLVQAQINSSEVDSVFVGQEALLRFSSFNQRTTPELSGTVAKISADVVIDQASGVQYYQADIAPAEGEVDRLGNVDLLPGMPVEVLMKTDDRSPMSFLAKPLTDYFNRAFRGS